MKVLLSGYYGFQNLGDEAILHSLIRQLRSVNPSIDITVLSRNPEETSKQYSVKSVPRKSIFQIITQLRKTDVLINGGGSLFQDETSRRSLLYYTLTMKTARLFRKKTVSISCGVGPIHSTFNRGLVRKEIDRSVLTTLRDPDSLVYLQDMGISSSSVYTTADLAIGLECTDELFGNRIIGQHFSEDIPVIAFALRTKDFASDRNLKELERLVCELSKTYNILFLPFYFEQDLGLRHLLEERKAIQGKYVFMEDRLSIQEYMSVLSNCRFVIGERLHSLILALVTNTPFIGISYDPKIDAFMRLAGKQILCKISNISADIIVDEIHRMDRSYDEEKRKLSEFREDQKIRLKQNEELLKKIIGSF